MDFRVKRMLAIAAVLIVAAIGALMYFSIPHNKPIPISSILNDADLYRSKSFMVEGNPVILQSLKTGYGSVYFFAIKDATGQIPVSGDVAGLQLVASEPSFAAKIALVGTLGDVCVHARYNQTSDEVICDKKELGIVS